MGRGKRYDGEQKLNLKKVIATLLVIAVLIMIIILAIKFPKKSKSGEQKNISNSYITIYTNGKWGVINSKGDVIVKPTYDDMIIIPDETKPVFICEKDVDLEAGKYTSYAIDNNSKDVFSGYEKVEAIQNIDENGQVFYAKNVLKVYKDGKYGLINLNGKELLACNYTSIEPIKCLSNSFLTEKDGKKGLVDNGGSIIIDNQYEEIKALTNQYEDGYIVKNSDGKYGLINYNKKQILECKYEGIGNVYGNDMYVVKENGAWELVDATGEIKLRDKFTNVISIDGSNMIIKKDENYSVISTDGDIKLKDYQYLDYAFDGNYIAEKDNKYGIINLSNEKKINFDYKSIYYLKDEGFIEANKEDGSTDLIDVSFNVKVSGIVSEISTKLGYVKLRVNSENKYYNFKLEEKDSKDIFTTNTIFLSKKDGKYGFVNKNDVVVVDYIYDDATEQNDYGYAAVKKDGKWGAIDQSGNVILEPSLKLSQNTVISFIGKWHLAPDLNANYYTDVNE